MSAHSEEDEINNVLPVAAIAIRGLSALSTFENEINKLD